ncbi:flagellar hook-length control protein FliK [uncultured Rhodospira sp.]|uniref:flagellar hook-length control protein FliK n=1 Tax=uncultured Rhodospira sp. TaxID=1936189 RepID=UPI0026093E5C|nr:flagellar hook-length control protein FliK [uncultured Rhodospira sp.]
MDLTTLAVGPTAARTHGATGATPKVTPDSSSGEQFAAYMDQMAKGGASVTLHPVDLGEMLFATAPDDPPPADPVRPDRETRTDETTSRREAASDDADARARETDDADAADSETDTETASGEDDADTASTAADQGDGAEADAATPNAAGPAVTIVAGDAAKAETKAAATPSSQAAAATSAAAQAKADTAPGSANAMAGAAAGKGTAKDGAATGARAGSAQAGQAGAGAATTDTAKTAQAQTATTATAPKTDAARAQAEALAQQIKPDAPLKVKVTVTDTARAAGAEANTAARAAGAETQTTATQAAAQQAGRTGADLTGTAALRQQAMDGMAQAQGEGFVSNTSGKGTNAPSIAEQNAAAHEAKAQARQHLADAQTAAQQARAGTEPEAEGQLQRGLAAASGQAAARTADPRPWDGLSSTPNTRATGPAANAAADAARVTPARGTGQGQTQGQMNTASQGSTGGGAPAPSTAAGSAEAAPGSGTFADQMARAGQGQGTEQARPDPQTRQVVEQLRVNISKAANRGMDRITVQLHPEKLGRVEVKLEFGPDGRVSAQVTVDKAETLEMLQRDARGLERALNDAGLKTDSGGIQFGLRGDGSAAQAGQDGRGRTPAKGAPADGNDLAGDDPALDPETMAAAAAKARGGINVRV